MQHGRVERTNEEWLHELRQPEPHCNAALRDLRWILERGLGSALARRSQLNSEEVEDLAQDALLKVLRKLDTFEGKSRFTTWALRVAINAALSELRKSRWGEVSLEKIPVPRKLFDLKSVSVKGEDPERKALQRSTLRVLNRVVRKELTSSQKKVFVAVQLNGMPLAEVSRRLGVERGALYKRMHDARKRIKAELERIGYSYDDFVSIFE
jgi:RNA polymerase sigma-70 factor (ECF subfamily)